MYGAVLKPFEQALSEPRELIALRAMGLSIELARSAQVVSTDFVHKGCVYIIYCD